MKKLLHSEIITNLLWSIFGFIGCFQFYNQKDYLPSGILLLIGLLYLFKLLVKEKKK